MRIARLGLLGIATLAILFAIPASGREVYVDAVNGNDTTGDGSRAAPWKTITHASSTAYQFEPDRVWIAPGIYDGPGNGEVFPIDFINRVFLSGSRLAPAVIRTGGSDALAFAIRYRGQPCGTVEDLVIEGSTTGPPAGNGIRFQNCAGEVLRSEVSGFARGVWIGVSELQAGEAGYASGTVRQSYLHDNGIGVIGNAEWGSVLQLGFTLESNLFLRNTSAIEVVACCFNCDVLSMSGWIHNNTLVECASRAVGISSVAPGHVAMSVTNNVIAAVDGFGVDDEGPGVAISGNDFWDVTMGPWRQGGGATPDNLFVDPIFVDSLAGDYHLAATSPCIDRAIEPVFDAPDFDGVPRPLDGDGDTIARCDIGAYEYDTGLHLRRGAFFSLAPAVPAFDHMFPFGGRNPHTPVIVADFRSGDVDSRAPDWSSLSLYQVDRLAGQTLHAVKEAAGSTIRFELR